MNLTNMIQLHAIILITRLSNFSHTLYNWEFLLAAYSKYDVHVLPTMLFIVYSFSNTFAFLLWSDRTDLCNR